MAFPPMFTISFALFSMNFTGWPVKGEATTEPTIVTALPGTTTRLVTAMAAPFPAAAPTAFTSSPKVTPGGTGRDWEDPPIRIGPTATETSPFVRCTSCMPAGTDTESGHRDHPGRIGRHCDSLAIFYGRRGDTIRQGHSGRAG